MSVPVPPFKLRSAVEAFALTSPVEQLERLHCVSEVIIYCMQELVVFACDPSMHLKAWRSHACGSEGDVSAEPCMLAGPATVANKPEPHARGCAGPGGGWGGGRKGTLH